MKRLEDTAQSYAERAIDLFNDANRAALESIEAKREGANRMADYYTMENRDNLSDAIEFAQIATDPTEWAE